LNATSDASAYLDVPPLKLALVTLHTVLGLMLKNKQHYGRDGVSMKAAAFEIVDALDSELRYSKVTHSYRKYASNSPKYRRRSSFLKTLRKVQEEGLLSSDSSIPLDARIRIGLALLEDLIVSVNIPDTDQPAFTRIYIKENSSNYASIYLHLDEGIYKVMEKDYELQARYLIRTPLMVVPPLPWKSAFQGPYYILRSKIMRSVSPSQDALVKEAHIPEVLQGLNVLSSVPWKINEKTLDIVDKIWNTGGGFAEIPTRTDIPIPRNA
jgi:DNA-directed RNA polymerase